MLSKLKRIEHDPFVPFVQWLPLLPTIFWLSLGILTIGCFKHRKSMELNDCTNTRTSSLYCQPAASSTSAWHSTVLCTRLAAGLASQSRLQLFSLAWIRAHTPNCDIRIAFSQRKRPRGQATYEMVFGTVSVFCAPSCVCRPNYGNLHCLQSVRLMAGIWHRSSSSQEVSPVRQHHLFRQPENDRKATWLPRNRWQATPLFWCYLALSQWLTQADIHVRLVHECHARLCSKADLRTQ